MITCAKVTNANGAPVPMTLSINPQDGSVPSVGTNQLDGGGVMNMYPPFAAKDGMLLGPDPFYKCVGLYGFLSDQPPYVTIVPDTRPGAPTDAQMLVAVLPNA